MAANKKLSALLKGRKVKNVRQRGAVFLIDFHDGSTMQIKLAEPTSSVIVRNRKKELEYLD